MSKRKKIAILIQNEVQLFSMQPLIRQLNENDKYEVRVLTDKYSNNSDGYKEMAQNVSKIMKKNNIIAEDIDAYSDVVFDLCLAAYVNDKIKSRCYLKYEYGTLNIKPSLTYLPEFMGRFHGFLCQSTVTKELLDAYGKTFAVDNLRFYNRRGKKIDNRKKKVLFAPTYNDEAAAADFADVIKELKKKYYVVIKGHHGTHYLKSQSSRKQSFEVLADEYYGSETCLSDLILGVDVCLFDNSSAIGEALYAKVPCAIFAKDLNCFKLGNVDTTQYELVRDGVLPYANIAAEVVDAVEQAMSDKYKTIQANAAEVMFGAEFRTGLDGYIKAIDYFLYDGLAQDYIDLKNYRDDDVIRKDAQKYKDIRLRDDEIKRLNSLLDKYTHGKLYKIADKIYKIEGRVLNVKS